MPETDLMMGDILGNQPQDNGGLMGAVGNVGEYLGGVVNRDKQARAEASISAKYDSKKDTVTWEMPPDIANMIHEQSQRYSQIQGIYSGMIAENMARQDQARKHPFANALAQIGASIASHDQNPLVRQIGAAAQDLNPAPGRLNKELLPLLEGSAATTEKMGALEERALSLASLAEQRRMTAEDRLQREHQLAENEEDKRVDNALKAARLVAGKGGGPMSENAFTAHMIAYGVKDPQRIKAAYADHVDQASVVKSGKQTDQGFKLELVDRRGETAEKVAKTRAQLQLSNSLALQANGEKLREHFKDYAEQVKKDEQFSIVKPKDIEQVVQIRQTEKYLDDLESLLADPKLASKMGAFKLEQYAPIWAKSTDQVKVQAQLAHEVPRILRLILSGQQGGVRLVSTKAGQEMMNKLGVQQTMLPDQARAVIGVLRGTLHNNRTSVMEAYPAANWGKYPELLGRDAGFRPKNVGAGGDETDPLGVR